MGFEEKKMKIKIKTDVKIIAEKIASSKVFQAVSLFGLAADIGDLINWSTKVAVQFI